MKYCYACGKTTAAEPLFCNFCGRSYDQKVCPRLHLNPRRADVCSRCGSRNLSTPQPRVPILWRIIGVLIVGFTCAFLVVVTLGLVFVIAAPLLSGRLVPFLSYASAGLIAILWALWSVLPDAIRSVVQRSLQDRRSHD
jgi:hypothetical protein